MELNDTSIITLSNNFSFTFASISETKISDSQVQFSIDKEQMNTTYTDYSSNTTFSSSSLKFMKVTEDEIKQAMNYYRDSHTNDGLTIGRPSNDINVQSIIIKNLTIEEAFMLMLYFYKPLADSVTANANIFYNGFVNLLKDTDAETITYDARSAGEGKTFAELINKISNQFPSYLTSDSFVINAESFASYGAGNYDETEYVIGVYVGSSDEIVEIITSNILKVSYTITLEFTTGMTPTLATAKVSNTSYEVKSLIDFSA